MTFPVLSAGTSAYNLTNSLRLRASANAYLNRTPASASNRTTWTWSAWVKRGLLGSGVYQLFAARTSFGSTYTLFYFDADSLKFLDDGGANIATTAVYRDPSAWYHVVLSVNTTSATASQRVRIYINGVEVTAFSSSTYPTQNANLSVNSTLNHNIARQDSAIQYFDGYLDEINFIDGQALTPSAFGSTNPVTGVWQPAKYTGTYGTNGFYLPFTNTTSTTTLGNDFSGNGNNWTTNNISLTPGVTYDSMTDVPTLTSATAANYCVLNPLIVNNKTGETAQTFSNANLQVRAFGDSNGSPYTNTQSTFGVTTGKWYFEVTHGGSGGVGDGSDNEAIIGVVNLNSSPNVASGDSVPGQIYTNNGAGYYRSGSVLATGATVNSSGNSYTTNDVIGVALDLTNLRVWFSKNGVWQGTGSPDPATNTSPNVSGLSSSGVYVPSVANYASSNIRWTDFIANFGQRPFAYTPPSGFLPLNTFNLPNSTIPAGNKFMDVVLRNGGGSSGGTYSTTINMANGALLWDKPRNIVGSNYLVDSVRGISRLLSSDQTAAETTLATWFTAFNNGSFSTGSNDWGTSVSIVDWIWAANGAGVTNTAGTITSSVSANTTSGFSVVTYTGTGTNGATVGHGLNVTPGLCIVKRRDTAANWVVVPGNSTLFGGSFYLQLNTTSAVIANSNVFTSYPGSTVFYLSTSTDVNASGGTYVAYCFAQIAGFSAFGSYTGNGSADGPFIYTGFRPRWIMCKSTTETGSWTMIDTARIGYNANNSTLYADLTTVEQGYLPADILSNGFKIRIISTGTSFNSSGQTYIYMAFAENPFKNALAR